MVDPIMKSIHFECPKCGQPGMAAELQGTEGYRLVDDNFRQEMREGELEVVCAKCGAPVSPSK